MTIMAVEHQKALKRIAELEADLQYADRFGSQNRELVNDNCKLRAERDRLREAIIDALPYMEPSDTRFLLEKSLEETT